MGAVNTTMHSSLVLAACLAAAACAAPLTAPSRASGVTLATFDGGKGTTFKWKDLNDPVMGGASTSTFTQQEGVGIFNGTCRIVSFLHAPGFAKATTSAGWFSKDTFHDASSMVNGSLTLEVRSTTPEYYGFKAEFGAKGVPHHGGHEISGTFKAPFNVTGSDWQTVKVPFNTFSYDWSDYTGRCDTKDPTGTQHVCCSAAHPEVCPTAKYLAQISSVAVWAEGVAGDFHIEIRSIGAT